ncbi:MAG: DUF5829 family protein [Myxococcales bacterium]|nr:DUF5829 family protein [Myxococcales bacterium]
MRLNHFFVTASLETFDAVCAAGDLGAIEKRTTIRKDRTYTGVYLYGENTYLELLHPDSDLGAPCGIAWEGRTDAAELVYRGDKPWFWMSKTEPKFDGLIDWGMEYVPEYFGRSGPVSRSDALTHYAASCGKSRERGEGLFEDVAGLEMSLSSADLHVAITAARLTLRRDAGRGERKLGGTTLSLDGRTAVWRFEER